MGKAKKVGVSNPTKSVDNYNLTTSSKTIKTNKFRPLRGYECKKILQEKAKGLKNKNDDVLIPLLEKLSEKRVATMSYKDKGKPSDTFRLFGESHDSSHVSSTLILPSWAIQLKKEVEESRRMIEACKGRLKILMLR
ncbi:hypothetical protein LWI29_000541 [Acer saccharum]|uniref:Uncharacterized protein n=1 Tax=Acer saccharum TaxID=4024 RepID=A0AA39VIA0_ACESA|nr:hypothetical protein LWI29_000541 [Acer saccharum]